MIIFENIAAIILYNTVVNCGLPPAVEFGTTTDTDYDYQDEVTYTCMAGFELADGSSDVTLTCGADRQWSGYMPCQGTLHMFLQIIL